MAGDWFDSTGAELGIDPGQFQPAVPTGGKGATQWNGAVAQTNSATSAGGQDKQWLDWITATYGPSASRGGAFADLPQGQNLSQVIDRFNSETGAQAKYVGGNSGDQVDFGQGVTDALTAGGQLWSDYGAMSGQARDGATAPGGGGGNAISNSPWGGYGSRSGSGGGGPIAMPTAPGVQNLDAPTPFSYAPSSLGTFAAPSQTPTMQQQSYNPAATPTPLSYTNLATPDGYKAKEYTGLTAEEFAADPGRKFRESQALGAQANILAHSGALRTGNALQAQGQLASDMASQEYGAADQRARSTNQMNNATSLGAYQTNAQTGLAYNQNANQNALNFGTANYNQAFQTNQANNQGSNAAIQANNQNALQAQGQQFGQAATGYGLNQQAQQQGYNQAAGTYGMNAQNALAYNQNANQNNLANYQAQTNAALGLGNLNLGYQNSNNSYALGQGSLGLQQQGQQFNQANQTWQNNYQATVTDPWQQQYQLATLGRPT